MPPVAGLEAERGAEDTGLVPADRVLGVERVPGQLLLRHDGFLGSGNRVPDSELVAINVGDGSSSEGSLREPGLTARTCG